MTSICAIARELGVHPSTVMRRLNADPRKARAAWAGAPKASGHSAPIDPVDESTIRNGIAQGLKTIEIARELGVHRETVCRRAAKIGLNTTRGQMEHAASLRRAVQDMRLLETLTYALNTFEDMAGNLDESLLDIIGDLRLTSQQSQIYAVLHKNLGKAVSLGGLLSVMSVGSPTIETSVGSLIALIFCMRQKLTGHFAILTISSGGHLHGIGMIVLCRRYALSAAQSPFGSPSPAVVWDFSCPVAGC